MCEACIEKLENAYFFKKQCETVDQELRNIVRNISKQTTLKDGSIFILQTEEDLLNNIFYKSADFEVNQPANQLKTEFELTDGMFPEVVLQDQTSKSDYIDFMDNNQLILTCRTCNKVFSSVDGLKTHKRKHTGDLFRCKQCDKGYTRLNHLLRHELTHGKRKVHVCKICNKTLTRFEHLKRHLVTHLKEKPFLCNTCNRGFTRSDHLIKHAKKCKGQDVFICDICSKAYNRQDSLEVHRKMHENNLPEMPTLDNLDNIDDHYYELDCDESTFPAYSESEDDEELLSGDDAEALQPVTVLEEPELQNPVNHEDYSIRIGNCNHISLLYF